MRIKRSSCTWRQLIIKNSVHNILPPKMKLGRSRTVLLFHQLQRHLVKDILVVRLINIDWISFLIMRISGTYIFIILCFLSRSLIPKKTDLMWFEITYKLVPPISFLIYFSYKEARSNHWISAARQPLVLIKREILFDALYAGYFNKFTKAYILLPVKHCLLELAQGNKMQRKAIGCTCIFRLVSVLPCSVYRYIDEAMQVMFSGRQSSGHG